MASHRKRRLVSVSSRLYFRNNRTCQVYRHDCNNWMNRLCIVDFSLFSAVYHRVWSSSLTFQRLQCLRYLQILLWYQSLFHYLKNRRTRHQCLLSALLRLEFILSCQALTRSNLSRKLFGWDDHQLPPATRTISWMFQRRDLQLIKWSLNLFVFRVVKTMNHLTRKILQ